MRNAGELLPGVFFGLCAALRSPRSGIVALHGLGYGTVNEAIYGLSTGLRVGLDFGLMALLNGNKKAVKFCFIIFVLCYSFTVKNISLFYHEITSITSIPHLMVW